ncbi:MAG: hypothetical protein FWF96_02265 [Kiritimatiellaeota bacterium]|nr:hypothetical protein [Kiritimatiellota bacterium]
MNAKVNLLRTIRFQDADHTPFGLESARELTHRDARFYWGNNDRSARAWTDAWGVQFKRADSPDAEAYPVFHPLESWEDFENFPFPDPADPALFKDAEAQFQTIDRGENLVLFNNPGVLFVRSWLLRGMENALVDMIAEPERYEALLEKICVYQEAILRRTAAFKPDIVQFGDDAGTTKALMMRPALWRSMVKPRLKRLFDICKNAGSLVLFHCCGQVTDILDDIIEIGADILNPLQAGANDLRAVKQKAAGRLALYGGIDAHTVMTADAPTVARLTQTTLDILGRGGGYIAAPDQSLPFPAENLEAIKKTLWT